MTINRGLLGIGNDDAIKATNELSFAEVFDELFISEENNKFSIDSGWETGNIYYVNEESGRVKKINYSNTSTLADVGISGAQFISVIQSAPVINRVEIVEEKGAWVSTSNRILTRLNKSLQEEFSIALDFDPIGIQSSTEEGVFIHGSDGILYSFSPNGLLLGQTGLAPYVDDPIDLKGMAVDALNRLWVAVDYKLLRLDSISTGISVEVQLEPITDAGYGGLIDSEYQTLHEIGDIDIDRLNGDLYVACGFNGVVSWMVKYDVKTNLINLNPAMEAELPVVLKIPQNPDVSSMYMLGTNRGGDGEETEESESSLSEDYFTMPNYVCEALGGNLVQIGPDGISAEGGEKFGHYDGPMEKETYCVDISGAWNENAQEDLENQLQAICDTFCPNLNCKCGTILGFPGASPDNPFDGLLESNLIVSFTTYNNFGRVTIDATTSFCPGAEYPSGDILEPPDFNTDNAYHTERILDTGCINSGFYAETYFITVPLTLGSAPRKLTAGLVINIENCLFDTRPEFKYTLLISCKESFERIYCACQGSSSSDGDDTGTGTGTDGTGTGTGTEDPYTVKLSKSGVGIGLI